MMMVIYLFSTNICKNKLLKQDVFLFVLIGVKFDVFIHMYDTLLYLCKKGCAIIMFLLINQTIWKNKTICVSKRASR